MAHDPHGRIAPRTAEDLRRAELVGPPWWADQRRAVGAGAGAALLFTGLFLLARAGWLRHRSTSDYPIEADPTLVAILAVTLGVMWPIVLVSTSRPDQGFRVRGLAALLALAVLVVGAIDLVTIGVWSLLMDGRAPTASTLLKMTSDPVALLTVGAVTVTVHAWSAACVVGFVRLTPLRLVLALPTFLAVIGLGSWRAIAAFEQPPSPITLLAWSLIALLGLLSLAVLALVDEHRSTRG